MSRFSRRFGRARLRRLGLLDGAVRGCTCAGPEVEVVCREGRVYELLVRHDDGCPASGSETVLILPTGAWR